MRYLVTVILMLLAAPIALGQMGEAWVARYNGPGNGDDEACAVAVDSSGNLYVTGLSYGSGTGDDYTTIKYDSNGDTVWVARYNGPGNSQDVANALAVDAWGSVYVTGSSYGSGTSRDYATIKYDSNGDTVWVRRYNGPRNNLDDAYALAVDASGNVFVSGGSMGTGTYTDYTTIKYDSSGDTVWVRRYNGPADGYDNARALAVDGSGNVYVTGESSGGSATYNDYATIKYDSNGNQLWVRRYNGPADDDDEASAIAVDGSGSTYVTGESHGTVFDLDYATVKYDSSGNLLWVARYNGPGDSFDLAEALAVDAWGNVYVTGGSGGSGTSRDYATIKYDSNGDTVWVARYNGSGNDLDRAYALALDGSGDVYVTGLSTGSGTGYDYVTIKYDSAGNEAWVARYDGPGNGPDGAYALMVDGSGSVYVTGYSTGSWTLADYATIKYSPAPSLTCDLLTPVCCRGGNFKFKLTVAHFMEEALSGTMTFSAYSSYDCDPGQVLVTIPRSKTYPPGVTETYYYFKVPSGAPTGQYSASVSGTLEPGGYELFCCMNTDLVRCEPWKTGMNAEWSLVEVDHPEATLPTTTALHQNYPNPFNTATQLTYSLAAAEKVKLTVHNLRGQLVETVVEGHQEAGEHQIIWDASEAASGIYFYRLAAGEFTETRRMILVK